MFFRDGWVLLNVVRIVVVGMIVLVFIFGVILFVFVVGVIFVVFFLDKGVSEIVF